jgi:hypothetical protein
MNVTITIPAYLAAEYAKACAQGANRAGAAFEQSNQLSDETECVRLDALATIIRNAIPNYAVDHPGDIPAWMRGEQMELD